MKTSYIHKQLILLNQKEKLLQVSYKENLQIGYNRAARIIDMMEEKGIVSKANHVGKREVL